MAGLASSIKDAKRLISAGAVKIKMNSANWECVTIKTPSGNWDFKTGDLIKVGRRPIAKIVR
jgi:ribosomal protein S4